MIMRRSAVVDEDVCQILLACQQDFLKLAHKTLLLTGGSGFVGSYLIESVLAFNRENPSAPCRLLLPTRSVRDARRKWPHFFESINLHWFEWNGRVLNLPTSESCHYVIHAASPSDPVYYRDQPLRAMEDIAFGTSAILDWVAGKDITNLLYVSSGAVYGDQALDKSTLCELNNSAPDLSDMRATYAEAKRYCEMLCRASKAPFSIARLFTFLGPYQDENGSFAVVDFLRQAKADALIRINGDGLALRTYYYASDLAISLWKILLNGRRNEVYNVGGGQPVSIFELATLVADAIGNTQVIIEKKGDSQFRSRYIPSVRKLQELYAAQIDLKDGIARVLRHRDYVKQVSHKDSDVV